MEGRDGIAKVLDFGFSTIVKPSDTPEQRMSEICGTFCFMAPEVVGQNALHGKKCDCWKEFEDTEVDH